MSEGAKPRAEKDARAARLQAALRENLKRRKAQARARSDRREEAEKPHDSAGIVTDKQT